MTPVNFLGFRQVTSDYFAELSEAEKKGYLWFVRTISGDTYTGDIYLGNRHYGHFGDETNSLKEDMEALIGQIPEDSDAKDVISYINSIAGVTLDEALSKSVSGVSKKEATGSDDNDMYALVDMSGNTIEGSEFEIVYDTVLSSGISTTSAIGGISKGTKVSDLQGKSVSDIIDMILFPELYPTAATKPAVSSVNGGTCDSVVTVGSSVSIGSVSMSLTTGKFNAAFTQPTAAYASEQSITYVVNKGFDGYSPATGATIVSVGSGVTASLGENKITWTGTLSYEAPSNSPKTSYGNETTKTGATATAGSAVWTKSTSSKTKSTTTYGVYPVFTNISGGAFVDEPSSQAALTTGTTITIEGVPSEVASSKHFMFDFPTGRTATLYVKDLQGNYVPYASTYETLSETVVHTVNGTDYTYNRLVTTGALQGAGDYQISLSAALTK